ncbi:MAG TPA: permease prefix domain 1-containing protein, partial [Blastocatellia bacterium]|nr:permease prefix domain 1-containing protein [Blastocatellia bacterium]
MRFPFWRRKREQELDDEINSHLKMATQDHLDRGESASEAAQIARREFGNAGLVKEATKEIWGWASLERLGKDVAYAIRILTKRPGFTALAIATLALGIGTNAAIFSVINAVILQPLPFANPEQIVQVGQSVTGTATSNVGAAAYGDFVDWREKNHVFSGLSAFQQFSATMTGSGEPEVVSGAQVDSEFFHLLIINSEAGRVFQQEEDVSGAERVAVLSHELWASHFRTDKAAIG